MFYSVYYTIIVTEKETCGTLLVQKKVKELQQL